MRLVVIISVFCALSGFIDPFPVKAETRFVAGRAAYAAILKREAEKVSLPVDVADAVVAIESGYDPTRIGGVGEIGLMQVRPQTAAMLGFVGSTADLAKPEINIHYGVAYLAGAWRKANGDLCRALMKYRAGHGEEVMSALSVTYCSHAIAHLSTVGSSLSTSALPLAAKRSGAPTAALGAIPKIDIKLKGAAFWARHDARIKAMSARIELVWRRMAAR